MIRNAVLTSFVLWIAFLTVGGALAGKKKVAPKEETLLGTISCTVPTPKPHMPIPGPNGVPEPPDANGAVPAPGANVVPQPIGTVRECLAKGGQVVIRPDGGRSDVPIDNPEMVKGHEWHRVSISGYANGTSFHIMSLRSV